MTITRNQAIAYLTADSGRVPCSRYGRHAADMAPDAWRHATWFVRDTGRPITYALLDETMSLMVNDHPDVERDLRNYAAALSGANVEHMVRGYLECQLWTQIDYSRLDDDGNAPMLDENYSLDDVADEYLDTLREEFGALVWAHPLAVRMYLDRRTRTTADSASSYFGHDYYLTREHHGAGFWDRGLGELGDYLTAIAYAAGSAEELSDDGTGALR